MEGLGELLALITVGVPLLVLAVSVIFIIMWIVLCVNVGRIRHSIEGIWEYLEGEKRPIEEEVREK